MDEDQTTDIARGEIAVRESEIRDRLETLGRNKELRRRRSGVLFVLTILVTLIVLGEFSGLTAVVGLLGAGLVGLLVRGALRAERERKELGDELRAIAGDRLTASNPREVGPPV
ncbi:hypothetical protein ACFL0I_00170 [Gemmatimonadota bacterium]